MHGFVLLTVDVHQRVYITHAMYMYLGAEDVYLAYIYNIYIYSGEE